MVLHLLPFAVGAAIGWKAKKAQKKAQKKQQINYQQINYQQFNYVKPSEPLSSETVVLKRYNNSQNSSTYLRNEEERRKLKEKQESEAYYRKLQRDENDKALRILRNGEDIDLEKLEELLEEIDEELISPEYYDRLGDLYERKVEDEKTVCCDQCEILIGNSRFAYFSDREKDLDFCSSDCYDDWQDKEEIKILTKITNKENELERKKENV